MLACSLHVVQACVWVHLEVKETDWAPKLQAYIDCIDLEGEGEGVEMLLV